MILHANKLLKKSREDVSVMTMFMNPSAPAAMTTEGELEKAVDLVASSQEVISITTLLAQA